MKRDYSKIRFKVQKEYKCADCKKKLLPKEAYCYVDENNFAITNNARPYCLECYKKRYGINRKEE